MKPTLRPYFPKLVSYGRFVELMPRALVPLCSYLNTRKGRCTGIAFIDSTAISVCHNRRIHSHKVFEGWARRGNTSVGWFYGFKLHLVVNDEGELLAFRVTSGKVDDREPVPDLAQRLFGEFYGDRGYRRWHIAISEPLHDRLWRRGLEFITKLKRRMRQRLMLLWDKLMLRKRALIEAIYDQLKNISQKEHSRYRSRTNFMAKFVASLIAFTHQPKRPSLHINREVNSSVPILIA